MGTPASPVRIRGVVYPSVKAAAEALGVSPKTVYGAVWRGREDMVGLGVGKPMPVTIRGVTYQTARHAAEALGVTVHAVHSGLCHGYIDRVGLGTNYAARKVKGGRPRAVVVAGRTFPSIAELARFLGRTAAGVRVSLAAGPVAQGRIVRAVMTEQAKREAKARALRMAETQPEQGSEKRRAA